MLTNRCLTHTYVIYEVFYAWLQLRQLAWKHYLWTPASGKHTCSLFCCSSFTLASNGLDSQEEEEEEEEGESHGWGLGWNGSGWWWGYSPKNTRGQGFQRRPSVRDEEERDVEVSASLNRSSSHSLSHC